MRCLVWFREEDLRVRDNTALHHACNFANDGVIAVFIVTTSAWQAHQLADCRVDFIFRNLAVLKDELASLNIPLLVLSTLSTNDIPDLLLKITNEHSISRLYFNEQYELDEKRRDEKVVKHLRENTIICISCIDQILLTPEEIKTSGGGTYTIFTPFRKKWLQILKEKGGFQVLEKPKPQIPLNIIPSVIPVQLEGFQATNASSLWPAGESVALNRLQSFVENKLVRYHLDRDYPALDGTSQLSPYLAAGVISVRQCLAAAQQSNKGLLDVGEQGVITWVTELIWREFYRHILIVFPRVSMNKPFKLQSQNISWENNVDQFNAWKLGQTGIPIVDAAMRQLLANHWMHNRLRMVVAMFLSKNLLIDWRWGEAHFMQHLIDGDLASNNGGWQWAASTGTDAVPYFRIFNPVTQSQRFDPEGIFIKKYCPELTALNAKDIHAPWLATSPSIYNNQQYPMPIVDLQSSRLRAISTFKKAMVD